MSPQSQLAKDLSVASQALISSVTRNDGPGVHLATKELNSICRQIDVLQEEITSLKEEASKQKSTAKKCTDTIDLSASFC